MINCRAISPKERTNDREKERETKGKKVAFNHPEASEGVTVHDIYYILIVYYSNNIRLTLKMGDINY